MDVNVITEGVVSDSRGNIVERYLITDKGRVAMNDNSQFRDPGPLLPSQKATCVWSEDWTLYGHLHDCKPQ